jgi:hypothetical protein
MLWTMRRLGKTFTYVDLFPDEPGPRRTPMQDGGEGLCFVYVTNRNHCSYLFPPRPFDHAFQSLLDRTFPMGYAQLFVLQKLGDSVDDADACAKRICVFRDPERTHVGGGAVDGIFATIEEAQAAARRIREEGMNAVACLVHLDMSWH